MALTNEESKIIIKSCIINLSHQDQDDCSQNVTIEAFQNILNYVNILEKKNIFLKKEKIDKQFQG